MTYLAAAIGAVGIGGVVTLAIFIAHMAVTNRTDLKALVAATKTIGERNRDQVVRIERYKGLEDALEEKTDELARANAAVEKARELLVIGGGTGVDSINSALSVLSEMSAPSKTATSEGGDG